MLILIKKIKNYLSLFFKKILIFLQDISPQPLLIIVHKYTFTIKLSLKILSFLFYSQKFGFSCQNSDISIPKI